MIRSNSRDLKYSMRQWADWDVVVVGAGPAGTAAAINSARAGLRVLLVESKRFPRNKVCGGCLNPAAIRILERLLGLEHPFWKTQKRLDQLRILHRQHQFDVRLPTGLAVERTAMDHILVNAAISEGVTFIDGITADVLPAVNLEGRCNEAGNFRQVKLQTKNSETVIGCRCIVVATGLGKQSQKSRSSLSAEKPDMATEAWSESVSKRGSRVGIATAVNDESQDVPENTIQMAIAKNGYVGITRINDRTLHVAAAVDLHAIQRGGVKNLIQRILQRAGTHRLDLSKCQWKGTPALTTRAKRLAGRQVFLVGDAAGYVEPFTGEGIHWALKSGEAVGPYVVAACSGWDGGLVERWEAWYAANIQLDQRLCRRIAVGLKSPTMGWVAHQALRFRPQIAQSIVTRLNRDFSVGEQAAIPIMQATIP